MLSSFSRAAREASRKIAEAEQAAETRDQADEVVVEALFLRNAAEFVVEADGDDRRGALRIAVMQEQCARGQTHDAEDAIESLRKHALDFATDKAGGGQIEIRERQHVALDAALFFFVEWP